MQIKKALVAQILDELRAELERYESITAKAREEATHGEMKQEGKYDTRAIEAGYLAGAQARRLEEIKVEMQSLSHLELRTFGASDPVALGALVTLGSSGEVYSYFLVPGSGGIEVDLNGKKTKTLSLRSAIARALVGQRLHDEVSIELPGGVRDFEIVELS